MQTALEEFKEFVLSLDNGGVVFTSLNLYPKFVSFKKPVTEVSKIEIPYIRIDCLPREFSNKEFFLVMNYDMRGDECASLQLEGPYELIELFLENVYME